jgi:hypothetical protein
VAGAVNFGNDLKDKILSSIKEFLNLGICKEKGLPFLHINTQY